MADVLEHIEWFEHAGELELSAAGTLLIAEYVTAANPVPLLEAVMAEEVESRQDRKSGRERDAYDGSGKQMTSPEGEFAWYRRRIRPKHELVRAWCKHRSVTFVERLIAAEAEVQRLDALVATLVDLLRKHDVNAADAYEHEHDGRTDSTRNGSSGGRQTSGAVGAASPRSTGASRALVVKAEPALSDFQIRAQRRLAR